MALSNPPLCPFTTSRGKKTRTHCFPQQPSTSPLPVPSTPHPHPPESLLLKPGLPLIVKGCERAINKTFLVSRETIQNLYGGSQNWLWGLRRCVVITHVYWCNAKRGKKKKEALCCRMPSRMTLHTVTHTQTHCPSHPR